ncbi:MAG: amidohydrolase family protein [Limisphaerales bacterium]
MQTVGLVVQSYFDGACLFEQGPFTIEIVLGLIRAVHQGDITAEKPASDRFDQIIRVEFAMPGLVEAHCHLFLNGGELDFVARKTYLKAPLDQMLRTGHQSLERNLATGITLIRDAGDLHGVNTRLKADLAGYKGVKPAIRSPGRALRKAGGYGSFMAIEVTDRQSLIRAIKEIAINVDDLKILLTGIIDFEKGEMKSGPQFNLDEAKLIVKMARRLGLRTYAHCSGLEGLQIAVEAGIDSIEHGFFMTKEIVKQMADKNIAWVPTFSPVYFQYEHPEFAGWSPEITQKLNAICQNHFNHVALAAQMGAPVIAGSDAGSYGVEHGKGLIDELFFFRKAGLPIEKVLESGTSLPRRNWNCRAADIKPNVRADLLLLDASPFADFANIRRVKGIYCNGALRML